MARRLACLSHYYRRAHYDGLIARNPVEFADRPKVPEQAATAGISKQRARRLIAAAHAEGPRPAPVSREPPEDATRLPVLQHPRRPRDRRPVRRLPDGQDAQGTRGRTQHQAPGQGALVRDRRDHLGHGRVGPRPFHPAWSRGAPRERRDGARRRRGQLRPRLDLWVQFNAKVALGCAAKLFPDE